MKKTDPKSEIDLSGAVDFDNSSLLVDITVSFELSSTSSNRRAYPESTEKNGPEISFNIGWLLHMGLWVIW